MKNSLKIGLVLLLVLMALSFGVAFGEKDTTAKEVTPSNGMNVAFDGSNAAVVDSADANENEAVDNNETSEDAEENEADDANETSEDSVFIASVNYSKTDQWVEIKNNDTSTEDLTGWKLGVQNKTVFTFPKFMLDANAAVKVHSGTGMNSEADLYASSTLMTNANDEVSLLDAAGNVVSDSEETNEAMESPGDE
jgi:hypothetical protein